MFFSPCSHSVHVAPCLRAPQSWEYSNHHHGLATQSSAVMLPYWLVHHAATEYMRRYAAAPRVPQSYWQPQLSGAYKPLPQLPSERKGPYARSRQSVCQPGAACSLPYRPADHIEQPRDHQAHHLSAAVDSPCSLGPRAGWPRCGERVVWSVDLQGGPFLPRCVRGRRCMLTYARTYCLCTARD